MGGSQNMRSYYFSKLILLFRKRHTWTVIFMAMMVVISALLRFLQHFSADNYVRCCLAL